MHACIAQAAGAAANAAALAAAELATKKKAVRDWTIDDVCTFFTELKLCEYTAAIAENEVDGRMLQKLLAQKALDELGIKSKLHVIKIESRLEKLAEELVQGAGAHAVVRCLRDVAGMLDRFHRLVHQRLCRGMLLVGVQLTFGSSKYKRAYDCTSCPQPHEDDKVLAAVRTVVMEWASWHSVADGAAAAFLTALKAEWTLNEPIADMAQKVWTSGNDLGGREFCSILNELIREDAKLGDELAKQVATLAHAINSNVVTRGLGGDRPWPGGPAAGSNHNSTEPNTSWRGGGFSDTAATRAFFVTGKVYRTGGFLATSYQKGTAKQFIDRVCRSVGAKPES
jgi:hypothetical protein